MQMESSLSEDRGEEIGGAGKAQRKPVEFSLDVFAQLIGNASRLLTGVSALAPFKEANLGLAEWIAMTLISQNENLTQRKIAMNLGVTPQRANQLVESLSAAGLISLTQLSEAKGQKVVRITEAGRNALQALNAKLTPILLEPTKDRGQSVVRMVRGLNRLAKVVSPPRRRTKETGGGDMLKGRQQA